MPSISLSVKRAIVFLALLGDGTLQIIILGAGLDSRGYRYRDRLKNVRFLEVDYGPTQEHKKQRVRARSLYIWEGVTMYLPDTAITSTLRFIREHSAPGSKVAFDYTLSTDPRINNPATRFARWGERGFLDSAVTRQPIRFVRPGW